MSENDRKKQINSDQCRAARSLLGWSQDELATNASVSRATIADFEGNLRLPIRNNMNSIHDCLYAAGVCFVYEDEELGAGVRFRERKIEFTKSVFFDHARDIAKIKMRYNDIPFNCCISREAINDRFHWTEEKSDKEIASAVSEILHEVLVIAEKHCKSFGGGEDILITTKMLN